MNAGIRGLIPARLLQNIQAGDNILFLGADQPLGYAGAPLSRPELAAVLAQAHGLPGGLGWPETVQAYLTRYPGDRNGVVSFVKQRCGAPPCKPGRLHAALAAGGFRAVVSAWYDDLLEQALRDAGRRVSIVTREQQLPYAEEGQQATFVVKLFGSLDDPDSLVLDVWEHEELMDRLDRRLELVTAFATLRPPLFAGFDLAGRLPVRLYVRATHNLAENQRRAYAVCPDPAAPAGLWAGKNLEFIPAEDLAAFFDALQAQLPAASPAGSRAILVRRPPYKFLDYFQTADAEIFCGRDIESQVAARLTLSYPTLILFGPSGAGKTSLLLAGVLPLLEGYRPVFVRALSDPLPAIRSAVASLAGRTPAAAANQDLRAFLSETLGEQDKLVIVLDQFEEFFQRVGPDRRAVFFKQVAALLEQPERQVRFIFSLREDFLARLDEARQFLPDIFTHSFRLAALDRSHARVAISEPAARSRVELEAALVDALVGSPSVSPSPGIGRGGQGGEGWPGIEGGDLAEADGSIPPPALQIVMDRLYRTALQAHFPNADPQAAPPAGLKLTLAGYQAVSCCVGQGAGQQTLYGVRAILADYLDEGLRRLAEAQDDAGRPLEADPALGWEILKALVTSLKTKAALSLAELEALLEETAAWQPGDEADHRRLSAALAGLQRVRLLRSFERDGLALYEPAHDHLAAAVAARLSQDELGAKVARELLRQAADNWRSAGLLIALDALKLIHARCDDLRRLTPAELELLLRSALSTGFEPGYWFERAAAGGLDVHSIALEGLRAEGFRARTAAVLALAGLAAGTPEAAAAFVEAIIGMLADDYPQVRAAAIQSLERLQPDGEWRAQLKYECYVPGGAFMMGDDKGDSDEKPAHEVFLDAFYIGKYPVTNAEYAHWRQDVGQPFSFAAGKERHPAVSVSWYDARDYAAWAGMRLLSEAEWEKAASWEATDRERSSVVGRLMSAVSGRGKGPLHAKGRQRKYPWGDEFDPRKCNTRESEIGTTTEVGKFSPAGDSPYDCADMAGNVWEWTGSLKRDYPYRADDGRQDLFSGDARVLRGGSFYDGYDYARCAFRFDSLPYARNVNFGFRVGVSGPISEF